MFSAMDTLKIDSLIRKQLTDENIKDVDLLSINTVEFGTKWDYNIPTLKSNFTGYEWCRTDEEFSELFDTKTMSVLKGLDMTNILVAGGSVSETLRKSNKHLNDIDLFVYGTDEEGANEVLERVTKHLYIDDNYYIKGENCVTFVTDEGNITVQVILRVYKSISEILHGFDLGSSAVGFDGTRVYFTTLSKFSYQYSVNLVDTTRASSTFSKRLQKYWGRGFSIVLPYLNTSCVDNCDMFISLDDDLFIHNPIKDPSKKSGNKIKCGITTGRNYNFSSDYNSAYNKFSVSATNIKCLLNNKLLYVFVDDENPNGTFLLSKSRLRKMYNEASSIIDDSLENEEKINFLLLEKYLSLMDDRNKLLLLIAIDEKDIDECKIIIDNQLKTMIERLEKANRMIDAYKKVTWIIKNPGTQLTSSFNPVDITPQKWYGKYYTEI